MDKSTKSKKLSISEITERVNNCPVKTLEHYRYIPTGDFYKVIATTWGAGSLKGQIFVHYYQVDEDFRKKHLAAPPFTKLLEEFLEGDFEQVYQHPESGEIL